MEVLAKYIYVLYSFLNSMLFIAMSAGAVEYTDCVSAEG